MTISAPQTDLSPKEHLIHVKGTLLHILGGMDKLTSGEYFYNDEAVHDMSMGRLNIFRRDHVSFVFQNAALMKYYTVAENIEMPLLSMNVGKKERKKIIEEKMEAVGIALADRLHRSGLRALGIHRSRCFTVR